MMLRQLINPACVALALGFGLAEYPVLAAGQSEIQARGCSIVSRLCAVRIGHIEFAREAETAVRWTIAEVGDGMAFEPLGRRRAATDAAR